MYIIKWFIYGITYNPFLFLLSLQISLTFFRLQFTGRHCENEIDVKVPGMCYFDCIEGHKLFSGQGPPPP